MRTLITTRSNPWTALNNEFFRLFDDSSNSVSTDSIRGSYSGIASFPRYDIEEAEKHFLLSFDIPGVKKENLNIEVKDGVLTLSGERKSSTKKEGFSERFQGNFQRSFTLPENVDADKIEAHYEDGVLQVALPKAEAKVGKKIEIGHGDNNTGIFSKLIGTLKKEDHAA